VAPQSTIDFLFLAAGSLAAITGVFLLYRAVLHDRSRGRQRCPRCWYEVLGLAIPVTCPECGRTTRKPGRLLRTRRHYRLAAIAQLILVIGVSTAAYPHSRNGRWHQWLPHTALILMLPHVDADWPLAELHRRFGIGDPDEGYAGQYTDSSSRLWGWQWRMLAANCGRVAACPAPLKRRQDALVLLLQDTPDPTPAVPWLLRCLRDEEPKVRWLASWGIKATRWAYTGGTREQLMESLRPLCSDPLQRNAEAARLAIASFELPPSDPSAGTASLDPERVADLLRTGNSATLGVIYRRLRQIPMFFFWPYDGESGPYQVESFDLPLDRDPALDRVLLVGDPHGVHWGALVWLRSADGWRFAGAAHLPNSPAAKPQVFAPEGSGMLVCRKSAGHTSDLTYVLEQDLWFSVRPGRLRMVAEIFARGHLNRPVHHARGDPVNWELRSDAPRVLWSGGKRAIEYDLHAVFTAARSETWPADAPSPGELFQMRRTVRLLKDGDDRFSPDPSTRWADTEAIGKAILGSPDDVLSELLPDLLDLARRGTPEHHAWLRLFLELCADSFARQKVLDALPAAAVTPP
jgi:hypothetical protein